MTAPLACENLSFSYPGQKRKVLLDVSLSKNEGSITAITGKSGCGKSTLFYCLSGIIPNIYKGELSGNVRIFGKPLPGIPLPEICTMLGFVFQDPDTQLFSSTVEDDVAFGPENLCLAPAEIERRVDSALRAVGMRDFRLASPRQLSGGQKQLVALASTLALEPSILLFDEVMSQIDDEGRGMIKKIILSLKNSGKTILMIEHDPDNLDIANDIYVMRKGILEPA